MLFLLVLLAWVAAIGYIPFHFRKTKEMRSFLLGIGCVWYALAHAKVPDEDEWMGQDYCQGSAERGFMTGVVSVVIAGLALLVIAGFTLYWAW
jgi:hypothetical protein